MSTKPFAQEHAELRRRWRSLNPVHAAAALREPSPLLGWLRANVFAGRKPHDIARSHFLDWTALALDAPEPGNDDERLPERMRVPRGAAPGSKVRAQR